MSSLTKALVLAAAAIAVALPAGAQEIVRAYGPGGPLPAMKEAAEAFSKSHGVRVEVVGGPTDAWLQKARADADLIFSGSEYMMTDFLRAMEGRIDEATIVSMYLRPSAILVRRGNPKGIRDLPDLARPGMKVLVVQGAGQTGMWEDMAGKQGDIRLVRALRKNIMAHAANTGAAKQTWTERPDLDAWIVFNIWQVANPQLADLVPVSRNYVVYRSSGAALTKQGTQRTAARGFLEFLQSGEGAAIFKKWGWMTVPDREPVSG
jgi:accessory colonization factor AcfC